MPDTRPSFTLTPTGGALGAVVTDLDASRAVGPGDILALKQALLDHHILVFKAWASRARSRETVSGF